MTTCQLPSDGPEFEPLFPNIQNAFGGLCRTSIYKEIKSGRLRITKIGRRSYVHKDDKRRFRDLLLAGGAAR